MSSPGEPVDEESAAPEGDDTVAEIPRDDSSRPRGADDVTSVAAYSHASVDERTVTGAVSGEAKER